MEEEIQVEMRKIMRDHKLTSFDVSRKTKGFEIIVYKRGNSRPYMIFDHQLKNALDIGAIVRERFNANAYGWATQP